MRLGIDFGTSNTAAAVMVGGKPYVIPLEPGQKTLPTAVFFDPHSREVLFGGPAVAALIDGREGRFLRALKSVLGTPLMRERRLLGGQRVTLLEVVARFLAHVKTRAEDHTGTRFDAVLSGRPVRFHSRDAARNDRAAVDLAEAYGMAGFTDVAFLPEPEAAAYASTGAGDGRGLIVDIGGGTSDFTVFEGAPGSIAILASHGIRLGGTDVDKLLSLAHVMPLLGMGTQIGNAFGPESHTAPVRLFHELATWETIPFVYTADTRRMVADMAKTARDPRAFARLTEVIASELGHDIAFAVERAKIAANADAPGWGTIDLRLIEAGMAPRLSHDALRDGLAAPAAEIAQAAQDTVAQAGLRPADIGTVILVGGSSLLTPVVDALRTVFPTATLDRSDPFTGVVDGLAIAAAGAQRG